jgi:hypothetical protein
MSDVRTYFEVDSRKDSKMLPINSKTFLLTPLSVQDSGHFGQNMSGRANRAMSRLERNVGNIAGLPGIPDA